jgi:exopolysaccharide biosynthesis polyprenyl glycosylphosphotransferase
MRATDNPTTLDRLGQNRQARHLLMLKSNVILALDVGVGLALAYFCGRLYLSINRAAWPSYGLIAPLYRETLLCSVIVAFAFRQPRLSVELPLIHWNGSIVSRRARGVVVLGVLIALEFATRQSDEAIRLWLLIWSSGLLAWFCASRSILIFYCNHLAIQGIMRETAAVVGTPDVAAHSAARLTAEAEIAAILDDDQMDLEGDGSIPRSISELFELTRDGTVGSIVVAFDRKTPVEAQPALRHLSSIPARVIVCRDRSGELIPHRATREIVAVPLAILADHSMHYWGLLLKSVVDLVGALLLLCLLSPVALIVSVAIVLDSPGPVIFRQQRNGWCGRIFTIFKFRTMYHAKDAACRQTLRDDPRCTRVGAVLRRTSMDEVPQLWNVLRGEMSLVGPRPHADGLHVIDQAGCRIVAEYAQRQRVKPGLTGWAQIHGSRGAISSTEAMRKRIEYDLHYIDHWSVWLDIYILLRTPIALLKGENAF